MQSHMFLSQHQCSLLRLSPPPLPRFHRHIPFSTSRTLPCHFTWTDHSDFNACPLMVSGGIWDGCSQRKHDRVQTSMCTSCSNDENASVYRVNQNIFSEAIQAKVAVKVVFACCLFSLTQVTSVKSIAKTVLEIFPFDVQNFGAFSSPFACVSNTLNKPTPLQLDVYMPAFRDIRWSFARLIYLFNIQMERNVGTFLVVLLVACISFILIGGFLFFKLRYSTFLPFC